MPIKVKREYYNLVSRKFEEMTLEFCCEEMSKATKKGTDNEGYMELINPRDVRDKNYFIGSGLKVINFCPWCGKKLTASVTEFENCPNCTCIGGH